MKQSIRKAFRFLSAVMPFCVSLFLFGSCIEPPLKLPAQEAIMEIPIIVTDIEVVWNLDTQWRRHWYYGWDETDSLLFGPISYPIPSNYEVRRYFLGDTPNVPHTNVDPFTVFGTRFRRNYQFGYYDLLLWSNIDSEDGSQVLKVNDADLNSVTATTSVTRGLTRLFASETETTSTTAVTGLYNQPEIFYSTLAPAVHITPNKEDYDYYDEKEKCWVKHLQCDLDPLVYIYLVQVIFLNNDGRVVGTTGNAALSAFSSGVNVDKGNTFNDPVFVYFNTRYKDNKDYEGQPCQIIGGKLTTFGLCDMPPFHTSPEHIYNGSRHDLPNYLLVDIKFRNGAEQTLQFDVTNQCLEQCHGGVITVLVDCSELPIPDKPVEGTGSLFVPTVEDYDEVVYEVPLHY